MAKKYFIKMVYVEALERYRDYLCYQNEVEVIRLLLSCRDKEACELEEKTLRLIDEIDKMQETFTCEGKMLKAPWKVIERMKEIHLLMVSMGKVF